MKALLLSYTILLIAAFIFGHQDREVRILIGGLLFGAMVGAMCAFNSGWQRGQAAERWAQAQREHDRRMVRKVGMVEA